jgi:hypothetical protein
MTHKNLIRDTPCDLSVYRLRLGPELAWHVAVVGAPPTEDVHRRVAENLATGEEVTLPEDVVAYLVRRRVQQAREGEFVEKHYGARRRIR